MPRWSIRFDKLEIRPQAEGVEYFGDLLFARSLQDEPILYPSLLHHSTIWDCDYPFLTESSPLEAEVILAGNFLCDIAITLLPPINEGEVNNNSNSKQGLPHLLKTKKDPNSISNYS